MEAEFEVMCQLLHCRSSARQTRQAQILLVEPVRPPRPAFAFFIVCVLVVVMLEVLHWEIRLACKNCASAYSFTKAGHRTLTSAPLLQARNRSSARASQTDPASNPSSDVKGQSELSEPSLANSNPQRASRSNTTPALIPQTWQPSSLQHPRRSEVPLRVLPKAQVGADLTLSPKERLQIEYMTRRPPKPLEKPAFKERLLIYHGGLGYTNYIALLRVTTIAAAAFGLVILAPAYYSYENAPWWTVPLIIVATTGPFFLVRFLARPFVSWIYLLLPQHARKSPKTALEYSRNLPQSAFLQICFMRATALTSQVEVNVADLVPRKSKWPPTTFEWVGRRVDKGTWSRPNPTRFFVNQRSGTGKAARDTVPGIWENVYRRIMGVEENLKRR